MSISNVELQAFYDAVVEAAHRAGIPDSQIPKGNVTVTLGEDSRTLTAPKPSSS